MAVNFELANQKTDYGFTRGDSARSVYAVSVCSGIIMQQKIINRPVPVLRTFTKVTRNSTSLQVEVDP